MTALENELRALLTESAPDVVDTTGLAAAARARAARTRRRAGAAVAAGVLAVAGITATAVLSTGRPHAGPPAKPAPTTPSDDPLCGFAADPGYGGWGPADAAPSTELRAVALCPADPADPAWAELPTPAVLYGRYLDGIATGGGPPVENCERGRPALPGFSLVTVSVDGDTHRSYASAGMRCGGAQAAQSFAAGLAQQQYDATTPAGEGCHGMMRVDTSDPPRQLANPVRVLVCVTADPYTEAEPAPLRYRPLLARTLAMPQVTSVVDGLARATMVKGTYTDCPWRHAAIKVITIDSTGARSATLVRCQQDYSSGALADAEKLSTMRGTWPQLPQPAQNLLQQQVAVYLDGHRAGG